MAITLSYQGLQQYLNYFHGSSLKEGKSMSRFRNRSIRWGTRGLRKKCNPNFKKMSLSLIHQRLQQFGMN